jgi:hypothetical protein
VARRRDGTTSSLKSKVAVTAGKTIYIFAEAGTSPNARRPRLPLDHSFIYAINNGGAAELAVSTLPPDYPGTFLAQRLISTTAEGGAGASDSATGIYSTTARNNVSWIPLAKVKGTQTVAGTWAASPTQLDMAPFSIPTCAFSAQRSAGQSIASSTLTKSQLDTENFDADAVFDNVTNYRYQPNVAGFYAISFVGGFSALVDQKPILVQLQKTGRRS